MALGALCARRGPAATWALPGRVVPRCAGGRACGVRALWAGGTSVPGRGCPWVSLPPHPQQMPGGKARHHLAHVVPDRIVTRVELRLQGLKLRLTLGTCATVGVERRLDRPHIVHMSSQSLLDVVHGRQPPCDVAC